jgi:hypothetical protein
MPEWGMHVRTLMSSGGRLKRSSVVVLALSDRRDVLMENNWVLCTATVGRFVCAHIHTWHENRVVGGPPVP